MAKSQPLGFRIEHDIKDALTVAAKDDHRSVSSLVELVLAQWLRENGYLRPTNDRPLRSLTQDPASAQGRKTYA